MNATITPQPWYDPTVDWPITAVVNSPPVGNSQAEGAGQLETQHRVQRLQEGLEQVQRELALLRQIQASAQGNPPERHKPVKIPSAPKVQFLNLGPGQTLASPPPTRPGVAGPSLQDITSPITQLAKIM
ncbi:hypothetical protein N7475_008166 [Penicillium sp. IBT 31633x]|nr:hypothetical protein N7475_008166 [Penicillium sp. IBT 31633x]